MYVLGVDEPPPPLLLVEGVLIIVCVTMKVRSSDVFVLLALSVQFTDQVYVAGESDCVKEDLETPFNVRLQKFLFISVSLYLNSFVNVDVVPSEAPFVGEVKFICGAMMS